MSLPATSSSNFYPRPPGGGRHLDDLVSCSGEVISIHALRVEGDRELITEFVSSGKISIHALRVEGDKQKTHDEKLIHISIHALRVEGDVVAL